MACPDKALEAKPIEQVLSIEDANWTFSTTKLPERHATLERASVKGSQFSPPLLEFSGACEGCGETPYVKLLTQLFGERLIIANATGCSSIWGGRWAGGGREVQQRATVVACDSCINYPRSENMRLRSPHMGVMQHNTQPPSIPSFPPPGALLNPPSPSSPPPLTQCTLQPVHHQ